jgi:hypothetical protein
LFVALPCGLAGFRFNFFPVLCIVSLRPLLLLGQLGRAGLIFADTCCTQSPNCVILFPA